MENVRKAERSILQFICNIYVFIYIYIYIYSKAYPNILIQTISHVCLQASDMLIGDYGKYLSC